MSEGGCFPWRRQRINNCRGPRVDHSNLASQSLPEQLPQGWFWVHNLKTRTWWAVDSNDAPNVAVEACEGESVPLNVADSAAAGDSDGIPFASVMVLDAQDNEVLPSRPPTVASTARCDARRDARQDSDESALYYLEHNVIAEDTFVGICLKYKITSTQLRRANCFSGSNLLLAPNPLRIPIRSDRREDAVCDEAIYDHSSSIVIPEAAAIPVSSFFPPVRQSILSTLIVT